MKTNWMNVKTLLVGAVLAAASAFAADTNVAATAINSLGIDLLRQMPPGNCLISPYSIQCAMAMTYAGADGVTRTEMQKVLHYPDDEAQLRQSLAGLEKNLNALAEDSAQRAAKHGGQPLTFNLANRLYGQQGYDFRPEFLAALKNDYDAPFQPVDFKHKAPAITGQINGWVEEQTHQRIKNLIPDGALDEMTRLVLVNALYFKADWKSKFSKSDTHPLPFYLSNGTSIETLTMKVEDKQIGFAKRDTLSILTIPYESGDLQLLILLPNATNGLADLEKQCPAELLGDLADIGFRRVTLFLPKLHLEPPTIALGRTLQTMGMKTAFDQPRGSANFNRMASRKLKDYLAISDVFHKTFLDVDETGTEAAAATAVTMMVMIGASQPLEPLNEVHVDHPFLFAIQHRSTGACLFLGRIETVDPAKP